MLVMMDLESTVKELLSEFLHPKPRSICICSDPFPLEFDVNYWAKCKNCGQILSMERCVEYGIIK